MQALPTGVVVVSTPQAVALADARSFYVLRPLMFLFWELKTWLILHQKNYLIISITFWKEGAKNLAEDLGVPLGGIPIVQSIREAGDYGRPAAMQTSAVENIFDEVTRNVVQETVKRNENYLPARGR
jgi:ATP-binding protein involved in chromosome partitioning